MAASAIPTLTLGVTTGATALLQYRAVDAAGVVSSANAYAIGITQTAAAIGARCPITSGGTAIATAGAAVQVGDLLEVGSAGKLVTWATSGVEVGRALTAAAADGDLFEMLFKVN